MQPVKCYTGKEATLKKFVDIGKEEREATLKNMKNIISDIFIFGIKLKWILMSLLKRQVEDT